jgi:PAS domain S-box-containing protein
MHAGGGTPAGVWMAFTDIDAGVRARDALAESELRYRGLVENMTDLIVGYDLDLRYTYVSPAFSRFMNADPGDFLGKTHREAGFPEELADFFDDALRRCLEFRTSIDVEFQAQGGDGPIEAEARVYPQLDGEGRPTGAFTLTRDVTERKRTAAALLDSEAMRDVAESVALVGSWSWSPATQQTTWSPEMYRLFDVGPEEFDGNFAPLVEARVHPDDRDLLLKTIAAVVETGAPIPAEYRVVHRDGSVHILHGEGRVDGGDDVSGPTMFGYYQDVTEQRRVEAEILRLNDELEAKVMDRTAQLEATNKELEAFAYSVSHDLRAPLRAIDGFSQIVMEDAADKLSEADVEHLQRVRAGAQRMATLIDELLGLSRISRKDLLVEEVDVSALATSVLDELREAQPERQVETVVAPGMRAEADTVLLRVILVNLLSNAWKFTGRHETARIEVGVTDADGERAFYVRDDGAGFDAQYATHLFGAFQRMHAAGLFEGDGIGLATVQRLVTRHGGRVWAEAEVEQGATFSFTLPGEATRK